MKARKRVHMIGNAHLDPAWLWRWSEGWQEASATFKAALDLLKEDDEVVITRGDAVLYQWLEESHPEIIEAVKPHVASGRWQLVGGWVVQSDCNLPCGEAFIRQALLGNRYFAERFGVTVRTAYCVDSFGHAATLPSLLAGCGFTSYVMMRPSQNEKPLPSNLFRWQGPDGAEVLVFRIPGAYTTSQDDFEAHFDAVLAQSPQDVESTMCFYGVGDHGGGPTRAQVACVHRLRKREDVEVRFSDPQTFFDEVRSQANTLPVVRDELQYHAIGSYSAVHDIKKMNRMAENALLEAETFAALAWATDTDAYPSEALRADWTTLLFNQFHDISAGSCIKSACDDAVQELGGVRQRALHVTSRALRRLARRINTRPALEAPASQSFIVFNTTGRARREIVACAPWFQWASPEVLSVADAQGRFVSCQRVDSEAAVNAMIRLLFPVEVPPFGYSVYSVFEGQREAAELRHPVTVDGLTLSNGLVRATIDRESGMLSSLEGPEGLSVLERPMAFEVIPDDSDTWSHGIDRYGEAESRFEGASEPVVVHRGPLRGQIRTEARHSESRLVQEFILDADSPFLKIRIYLNWRGSHKVLKAAFPIKATESAVTAEIPHGAISRPADGREYPALRWVDLSDRSDASALGLTVANDGLYAYSAENGVLKPTLLRCPPYAHDMSHRLQKNRRYDVTDQGPHEFTLALMPHAGACNREAARALADALNRPLAVTREIPHAGAFGSKGSLLPLESDDLEWVAVKKAEAEDRLVVRVLDVSGRGGTVKLQDGRAIARVRSYETVSLSLDPKAPGRGVQRINHVEEDIVEIQ
ncbi:MAG: alpha-mannosidase [Candidatus Latescibacteria bacterium]|nr:alpha-mannosidase [Candidatus Latescibacterota bacterium]